MRAIILKTCGVAIGALALGLSLIAAPAVAQVRHGGPGGMGGGHQWHAGGVGGGHAPRGGFGGGGFGGGGYGGRSGGGYGGGYGYYNGYGGPAVGLGILGGVLGGAIIESEVPYYGSGYGDDPQGLDGDSSAYCANRFKSYDPASGTYLGYDGQRHSCP